MTTHRRRTRLPVASAFAVLMLALLAPAASATTAPIGLFKLLGNTANSKATALSLAAFDPDPVSAGWPVTSVGGSDRMVFGFGEGDALQLAGVPTAARGTYTIEIWFKFDQVGPAFRRLMSFGPNDWDGGLYVHGGYLYLYPYKETANALVSDGQWVKVRVTRSGSTKVMKVYLNGVRKLKYTDTLGEFQLIGGQAVFFQDDGSEHSSGNAAQIRVWDRVVTP